MRISSRNDHHGKNTVHCQNTKPIVQQAKLRARRYKSIPEKKYMAYMQARETETSHTGTYLKYKEIPSRRERSIQYRQLKYKEIPMTVERSIQ